MSNQSKIYLNLSLSIYLNLSLPDKKLSGMQENYHIFSHVLLNNSNNPHNAPNYNPYLTSQTIHIMLLIITPKLRSFSQYVTQIYLFGFLKSPKFWKCFWIFIRRFKIVHKPLLKKHLTNVFTFPPPLIQRLKFFECYDTS